VAFGQLPPGVSPAAVSQQPQDDEETQWLAQMAARMQANQPYAKSGPYETQLDPAKEQQFRAWVKQNKVPFNLNDPISDYDMRGFWNDLQTGSPDAQTAVDPNDGKLHFTDKWKTPYHETFSRLSTYAQPNAPYWLADRYLIDHTGNVLFDDQHKHGPNDKAPVKR